MNERAQLTAEEQADRETIRTMARLLARTAGAWRGHLGFLKVDRLALERLGEEIGKATLRELETVPNEVGIDPDPKVIASMAAHCVRSGLATGVTFDRLGEEIGKAVLRELEARRLGADADPRAIAASAVHWVRAGLATGVRRG